MKLENFADKEPGKIEFVLGWIFGIGLFCAYRVGVQTGAKWSHVLLLVLSILILIFSSEMESTFIKFCSVVNILYAVLTLTFNENWSNDWLKDQPVIAILLTVFVLFASVMSVASGIFVLIFGILVVVGWRLIVYAIIYGVPRIPGIIVSYFWSKVRGPLPNVQSIVKRDKRIYLHKDYHKEQIQVIYKQGTKRKILDTYEWKDYRKTHYSLEWDYNNCVTVHKYDAMVSQQVDEKKYKI